MHSDRCEEETVIDVLDVVNVDGELLHVSLTADEVTRLFELLPADEPICDHIEFEMKCQGKWRDTSGPELLRELEDAA